MHWQTRSPLLVVGFLDKNFALLGKDEGGFTSDNDDLYCIAQSGLQRRSSKRGTHQLFVVERLRDICRCVLGAIIT